MNYKVISEGVSTSMSDLFPIFNKPLNGISWKIVISNELVFSNSHTNINFCNLNTKSETLKQTEEPEKLCAVIYSLLSKNYKLKKPISVNLEIQEGEVLAIMPGLNLYGEGLTEIEALNDLEIELIDLYKYLKTIPEQNLGKTPKKWKEIITSIIQIKSAD